MAYLFTSNSRRKLFLAILINILFLSVVIPQKANAVRIFFDGVPTTERDVTQPANQFYGGSDSRLIPLIVPNSTHLTFTTSHGHARNVVDQIYGGGRSAIPNIGAGVLGNNLIRGDVNLIVENTNAAIVAGGSEAVGGPVLIDGSIFLTVLNSDIDTILGGSSLTQGFGNVTRQRIDGSITMNLDNVTARIVHGAGTVPGNPANNGIAVNGDVIINVKNSTITDGLSIGGGNAGINIGGNGTLNISNSTIGAITATLDSNILGAVTLNLNEGTTIREVGLTYNGIIGGQATINMDGASVTDVLSLGPSGPNGGILGPAVLNMNSGSIKDLIVGSPFGLVNNQPDVAIVNMSGGNVNLLVTLGSEYSELNFLPGRQSSIVNTANAVGLATFSQINVYPGAKTQWGNGVDPFGLTANHIILSGELFIPKGGTVDLFTNHLTVNGGMLVPLDLTPENNQPIFNIFEADAASFVTIQSPLGVDLSYSPTLIGANYIPLASASDLFAIPGIFKENNTQGILWSKVVFNPEDNTWFLTDIKGSDDFYSFSAAREASNWLRQHHIWSLQRRSNKLLDHNVAGLWINVQGGYEKLDAAIGDAKLPWVMASLGYDYVQNLPNFYSLKALYGLGFGFATGRNKWSTINSTTNDIRMGMVAAYLGLMHEDTGLYATVAGQFTANQTKTKCTGFNQNYKWTETVPTEAFELGFKWALNEDFSLNPRGQVILEQLSKHHFKLSQENDTVILDKNFLATTVVGLAGEYNLDLGTRTILKLQASVDWIKGISGDFAAKSRILQRKFKDKNDTSTFRATLGASAQLVENLEIHLDGFADFGNDKGFGGQAGATYRF